MVTLIIKLVFSVVKQQIELPLRPFYLDLMTMDMMLMLKESDPNLLGMASALHISKNFWCFPVFSFPSSNSDTNHSKRKRSIVFHNKHHAKMLTDWQKLQVLHMTLPIVGGNFRPFKQSSRVFYPCKRNHNNFCQWVQQKHGWGKEGPEESSHVK